MPGDEAILALLDRYDELWNALDLSGVLNLWDEEDSRPLYVADEYVHPIEDWNGLRQHYGRLESRFDFASVRTEARAIKTFDGNTAVVLASWHWALRGFEMASSTLGTSWITFVLRQRPSGWRICHYMEAPDYHVDGDGRGGVV